MNSCSQVGHFFGGSSYPPQEFAPVLQPSVISSLWCPARCFFGCAENWLCNASPVSKGSSAQLGHIPLRIGPLLDPQPSTQQPALGAMGRQSRFGTCSCESDFQSLRTCARVGSECIEFFAKYPSYCAELTIFLLRIAVLPDHENQEACPISIVVTSSLGDISNVAAWGHYQCRATGVKACANNVSPAAASSTH